MSFWIDLVSFIFATPVALLAILHLWAFIWPRGKISERLHPHPPYPPSINDIRGEINRLLEGLRPPPQPDPLEDPQLVTTVRRRPRRR